MQTYRKRIRYSSSLNHKEYLFPKGIFRRDEISVGDYLMSLREPLTKEFLKGFNSIEKAIKIRGVSNLSVFQNVLKADPEEATDFTVTVDPVTRQCKDSLDSWWHLPFKYTNHNTEETLRVEMEWEMDQKDIYSKLYPTAYNLVKQFGSNCPLANYSVMSPNSVLKRHTGPENRSGRFVRIHIPLIIPDGDIFLEVNGEEVDWSDLFGFNNQLGHSSHNYSNEYRLIFLLDLDREFCGLPPGEPYDINLEKYARPFIRNGKEWDIY